METLWFLIADHLPFEDRFAFWSAFSSLKNLNGLIARQSGEDQQRLFHLFMRCSLERRDFAGFKWLLQKAPSLVFHDMLEFVDEQNIHFLWFAFHHPTQLFSSSFTEARLISACKIGKISFLLDWLRVSIKAPLTLSDETVRDLCSVSTPETIEILMEFFDFSADHSTNWEPGFYSSLHIGKTQVADLILKRYMKSQLPLTPFPSQPSSHFSPCDEEWRNQGMENLKFYLIGLSIGRICLRREDGWKEAIDYILSLNPHFLTCAVLEIFNSHFFLSTLVFLLERKKSMTQVDGFWTCDCELMRKIMRKLRTISIPFLNANMQSHEQLAPVVNAKRLDIFRKLTADRFLPSIDISSFLRLFDNPQLMRELEKHEVDWLYVITWIDSVDDLRYIHNNCVRMEIDSVTDSVDDEDAAEADLLQRLDQVGRRDFFEQVAKDENRLKRSAWRRLMSMFAHVFKRRVE